MKDKMKKTPMKRKGKPFFLIFVFSALLFGCSAISPSTQPNISALYRMETLRPKLQALPEKSRLPTQEPFPKAAETLFEKLYTLDPPVALEVGRLPEFQDKVGEKQVLALARFTDIISNASPKQKTNLIELLKTGKPEIRRYCAPLQAIFWLLEKDESLLTPNPLHYPLKDILLYAWLPFKGERWQDWKTVTDRLNAPELINFFEQANFRYQSHGVCPGNERQIFALKTGCCSDYTAFSVYCLRKAGYDASAIKVVSPTGKPYHVVCEYKDGGKKYIMDNSCFHCTGGLGILEKEVYERKLPQIGYGYL